MASLLISIEYLKNTDPSQTLPKTEEEGTGLYSFYDASINLIPKPDKDTTRKKKKLQTNITYKYIYKILANQIQLHVKKSIQNDQVEFNPKNPSMVQHKNINGTHHLNRMKEKKKTTHMIISIDTEKIFGKIQQLL